MLIAAALLGALTYRLATDGAGDEIHEAVSEGRVVAAPELDLDVLTAGDLGRAPRRWWRSTRDGRLTLSELRGNPVVLNFWTTRCSPCRQEGPALERVADEAGQRVVVLGVGNVASLQEARAFVEAQGLSFPQVHDSSGHTPRHWGVDGVPETFFLDRDGEIVGHIVGVATTEELRRGVAAAVSGRPAGLRRGGPRKGIER